jgi:hypothetical protein
MKNQLLSPLSTSQMKEGREDILTLFQKTLTFMLVCSFCFSVTESLFSRFVSTEGLTLSQYLILRCEEIISQCIDWARTVNLSEKDLMQYLLEWLISMIALIVNFFKGLICAVW